MKKLISQTARVLLAFTPVVKTNKKWKNLYVAVIAKILVELFFSHNNIEITTLVFGTNSFPIPSILCSYAICNFHACLKCVIANKMYSVFYTSFTLLLKWHKYVFSFETIVCYICLFLFTIILLRSYFTDFHIALTVTTTKWNACSLCWFMSDKLISFICRWFSY